MDNPKSEGFGVKPDDFQRVENKVDQCLEAIGRLTDAGNAAGGDEKVAPRVDAGGRVDQASVADLDLHVTTILQV